METYHTPVLVRECLTWAQKYFSENQKISMADFTLGGGGHCRHFLNSFPALSMTAFDQDMDAINYSKTWAPEFLSRLKIIHTNFEKASNHLGEKELDLVLMDLGVSSFQFDQAERGFSFRRDGPLDMRMNQDKEILSASEIINTFSQEDLANLFYQFGEERLSRRIAAQILEHRAQVPIQTTKELEDIVFNCYPKSQRYGQTHPATRVFQAIRIFVNDELGVLERTLHSLGRVLKEDSLVMIISFHSLEDRIVKTTFKSWKESGKGEILTKKPLIPGDDEIKENPRARSSKLRIFRWAKEGQVEKGKKKYSQKKFAKPI